MRRCSTCTPAYAGLYHCCVLLLHLPFIAHLPPPSCSGADSDAKKAVLLKYLRAENFLVLAAAFVINLFVISLFADGFYGVVGDGEVSDGLSFIEGGVLSPLPGLS